MSLPITVSVGPLATADPDIVCLLQSPTVTGAHYLAINGAGAAGTFTANDIAQSQSPGGAVALTLNGTTVTSGVAYLRSQPMPQRIYITSAADDSAVTFAVVGTVYGLNGPVSVTETMTGSNASVSASTKTYNTIVSITTSGATTGAVTVGTSGTATLDYARRIIITSGGNDSGITFALAGTDWAGNTISETITGANAGVASSVLDYKTVTSVRSSEATAGTVTVGTNGIAGSPWVRFDDFASLSDTTLAAIVSGTVNYDVQTTMDDPNRTANPTAKSAMTWLASLDTAVVGATASKSSYFNNTPIFARVLLNSGSGSVTTTFRQAFTG